MDNNGEHLALVVEVFAEICCAYDEEIILLDWHRRDYKSLILVISDYMDADILEKICSQYVVNISGHTCEYICTGIISDVPSIVTPAYMDKTWDPTRSKEKITG